MGQALATTNSNVPATTDDYFAQLAAVAGGLKGGGDGKAYMKFDGNDGIFSYGADDEPLEIGTQLAVNMRSAEWGWVIWVDGAVVHEEMAPMITRQTLKQNLPDFGPYGEDDGPSEQYVIDMKMFEDPFVEMVFQANNNSKRRAMAALMKDFAAQFRLHPGEVPCIELGEREFETTTKGKGKGRKITKHAPTFKIVGWIPEEELLAMTQGSEEDYDAEPEPAAAAPRLAAPKPAAAEADRPPRRARQPDPDEGGDDPEPAPATTRRQRPAPAAPVEKDEPAPAAAPKTRRQAAQEPDEGDDEPAPTPRRAAPEEAAAPAPAARRGRF